MSYIALSTRLITVASKNRFVELVIVMNWSGSTLIIPIGAPFFLAPRDAITFKISESEPWVVTKTISAPASKT